MGLNSLIFQTKKKKSIETIEIQNRIHWIANEKLETKQNIQFQCKAGVIFIHLTHIHKYTLYQSTKFDRTRKKNEQKRLVMISAPFCQNMVKKAICTNFVTICRDFSKCVVRKVAHIEWHIRQTNGLSFRAPFHNLFSDGEFNQWREKR